MPAFQPNISSAEALQNRKLIEAQQKSLSNVKYFSLMRFIPELEAPFAEFRYQRLTKRVPVICIAGLILFCCFSILDLLSLPLAVAQISTPIRMFLICPLIALIMYLSIKKVPARTFLSAYFSAYLISGFAITAIIYVADRHGHLLAYDGILLLLVFGYFLMSMPYTMAMYGGLIISVVYLAVSYHMNLQFEQLASNCIFIIGVNFLGTVGCYINERSRRFLFLNEQLVILAKEKDKKEIESKSRLVATASHDLRQPLNAMNLLIETLDDRLPEGETKEIVKSLAISTKQLNQLLSTLFDISKLNAGIVKPSLESLDLAEKIEHCCQEQHLRFLDSGIKLSYSGDQPALIKADSILLDRIIRNVVENIFIHSEANQVEITWNLDQHKAHLKISDNGKGIPTEDLQTIFDEFQQSGTYTSIGMGLGLTIVKQLAELQGIQCGLRSELGQGSCFWFDIPLSRARPSTTNKALLKASIIQSTSSDFASKWNRYLQQWGYETTLLRLSFESSPNLSEPSMQISNDKRFFESLTHINSAVFNDAQLLIIDLQTVIDINAHFESLNAWLENRSNFTSVLCVVKPNTTEFQSLGIQGLEFISSNVRPAKLRLILEHLRTSD